MRRLIFAIAVLLMTLNQSTFAAKKASVEVKHVHPEFWWTGMNNTDLQILIYGTNLGAYDVELENAQDVELKEIVKPDNKNYVILYLSLKNAKPHTFNVLLKKGKKTFHKITV